MDSVETLIPDNEGNHLVVVLAFYDYSEKISTFCIPQEFAELDIIDISINKIDLNKPLALRAFYKMCQWLIEQTNTFSNAVFSFICSTDSLDSRHKDMNPEQYRWNLFEYFFQRNISRLSTMGITSQAIIVGPEGYQTYARVFYRSKHSPLIHLVINHLTNKYL